MTGPHRVLIVEDDPATAEDLAELTRVLGCEPVVVDNKRDAFLKLKTEPFCFVLLDLAIKLEPDSLHAHLVAGTTLLKEIRELHPDHSGRGHRLPLLVLSGHVSEAESAVDAMREGADDVIQKPINLRLVSDRIPQCLARCERADHNSCIAVPMRPLHVSGMIEISIPGKRVKRRTHVIVRGTTLKFTDAPLRNLLHLLVGKLENRHIHKRDLGANDQGFKAISTLRKELAVALDGIEIIENDGEGHYWLTDAVSIGACNLDAVNTIGDRRLSNIAQKLQHLTPPSDK